MKNSILILFLILNVTIQAQIQSGSVPLNNEWVISTPSLDTIWIQVGGIGDITYDIWKEDPCSEGQCPVVIRHPNLTALRRHLGLPQPYLSRGKTGMLIHRPRPTRH